MFRRDCVSALAGGGDGLQPVTCFGSRPPCNRASHRTRALLRTARDRCASDSMRTILCVADACVSQAVGVARSKACGCKGADLL